MEAQKKNHGLTVFFITVAAIAALIASTWSTIASNINLGLDLRGGFEILYEVTPLNEGSEVDMTAVTNSISKRVDVMGVSEPQITVEGTNRVRVQLAGVADQETARQMLGTTANLTFRDINDNLLADSSIIKEGGASLSYDNGEPVVSLKIADTATFSEITKTVSEMTSGENLMVIWLDYEDGDSYEAEAQKAANGEEPKYISVASVNSQLTGDCIISGNFTEAEAKNLANLINSGSLPVKMTEISSNVVSAQYGNDALQKTAVAGVIGVLAVIAFMIWKYRMPGIVAGIMLAVYLYAIFVIYALIGAVFTLPGIGALVLGVGMTVDANIITFERTKQELLKGRTVRNAVSEGQKLSFSSIFDAQFTTLLAGLIMYWWGNGTVKGFATMLIITVLMTLVLNVAFSRFLLNLIVKSGVCDNKPEWFGVKKNQIPDVTKNQEEVKETKKQFDYLGKSKYIIRTSLLIFAVALVVCIVNAVSGNGFVNLGIDFASGTKLTVTSDTAITIDEVKTEMDTLGYSGFTYQSAGENTVYAVTKQSLTTDDLDTIKTAFKDMYGQEPGDNVVTPVVGRDLIRNALILTIVAWIAMMGYVTLRYKWDYGVSCIVALLHDVFMVLAIFAIFRLEVNTELISVLLTIIGYSINNAIVVFDRIRELVAESSGTKETPEYYHSIVTDALNKTITMAVYSSITTLLPVVFLLIMGSNAIFTFTFAMFIGLISGTLSAIFIAPSMWYWIRTHYKPKTKKAKKQKREKLDEYTIKGINA